jgi:hypothetical protein
MIEGLQNYIHNIYLFIYFTNDCSELTIFFEKLMILYLFSNNNKTKAFFSSHIKAHIFMVGADFFSWGYGHGLAMVEGPE